jgi:hypothetical protein
VTAFTSSADPQRQIPAGEGNRMDRIAAALATLAAEERRLERLGLVLPLQRCRAQRRYWTFLRAVFALPGSTKAPAPHAFPPHFDWER